MAEQDLDRNHAATTYKLEQARKRGSVAKSPDVTNVAVLAVLLVACHAMAGPALRQWAALHARWWGVPAAAPLDLPRAGALLTDAALAGLYLLAPLFMALAIVAILANLMQTGPVLSAEPLKPDFDRLNPAQGFKRLLSLKTLYLGVKSVIKLALLAGVFWWAFEALLGRLLALAWVTPKAQVMLLPAIVGGMLTKLWLVLLVLAVIDLGYMRWEFAKQMRMSQRELKDEHKQREGDPRVRRRLRELRLERLRQSRAMRQVPSADVVVTNPTRVAVALSYNRQAGGAPRLVAKGAGSTARQMRELAYRHAVPIVQNPPLARALYRQSQIGGDIPEAWYPVVAKILVWVYASREAGMRGAAA